MKMPSARQVLLSSIPILLTACDLGSGPKRPSADQASPAAAPQIPTALEETIEAPPELEYIYTPIGKRDPFKSYFAEFEGKGAGRVRQEVTELERYEIDQLKLVAIITGIPEPTAMVEDPTGKGHIVKRHIYMGKHNGKVTLIKNDRVIVTEEYRDLAGRKVQTQIEMRLPIEKIE